MALRVQALRQLVDVNCMTNVSGYLLNPRQRCNSIQGATALRDWGGFCCQFWHRGLVMFIWWKYRLTNTS